MGLRLKLLLPIVAVTAAMSFLTAVLVSDQVEQDALAQAQTKTAEYIVARAYQLLSPGNFQDPDHHQQAPAFESFMRQIKTSEIVKIKAYNAKFEIIYSTAAEDIGKKTDSALYRTALLENKVVTAIKDPVRERANIELYGYRQLMEVYVPITFDSRIEGVVEAYYRMDPVNSAVAETSRKIIGLITVFSLTIGIALFIVLTLMVVRPLRKLMDAAKRISAGERGVDLPMIRGNDEIAALRTAVAAILGRAGSPNRKE